MNHLAHALISGDDEAVIVGGFLGDFVHGGIDPALPLGVRRGLALHRAVDVYTDGHAVVAAARALFEPPYRRYAGIVLDIWFDHLLARDFQRWSPRPLDQYSAGLRDLLSRNELLLPAPLRRFLRYMRLHDLPLRYRDEGEIQRVFEGVGTRLLRANPLATSLTEVDRLRPQLQQAFDAFFPELIAFATQHREHSAATMI